MVYYSKRRRTRRPYRKRRTFKNYSKTKQMVTGRGPTLLEKIASGAGSVARLATAVAPMIAAINTEHKYVDNTGAVTAYDPGASDSIVHLSAGLINGTQDNQRIGNSILAKDIQLRMAINFPATVGSPSVMGLHCRATIICWKDNAQENPPTIAKIFEVPNIIYSAISKDYSDQFVVIKDKFFTVQSSAGITATAGFQHMKWFKKLNFHMRYDGIQGTDHTQNHIFLILRSTATGPSNALQATYYSRLNFTDN